MKIFNKIKNKPKSTFLSLGLAGLIGLTIGNDNVHFQSLTIKDEVGTHYIWGISPRVKIEGKRNSLNIHNFGLMGNTYLTSDSSNDGNLKTYSLVGGNGISNDTINFGSVSSFNLIGDNIVGKNSKVIGNVNLFSLIAGGNQIASSSRISGNVSSYTGLYSNNSIDNNSITNGEINTFGFFSSDSVDGRTFLKNTIRERN